MKYDARLLYLEDDPIASKHYTIGFKRIFTYVKCVQSLQDAKEFLANSVVDILVADIMLSDGNALEFLKEMRQRNENLPIILLSAHSEKSYLFKAIEIGVAAYHIKPVKTEILLASLKDAVQKPSLHNSVEITSTMVWNVDEMTITIDRQIKVQLTKKENLFVKLLISSRPNVVQTDDILNYVWENQEATVSSLRNLIKRLQQKIPQFPLKNIYGVGYKINN